MSWLHSTLNGWRIGAAGLTALALALVLTPLLRPWAVRHGWVVRPTQDRWKRRIVARLGGVAIFIAFLVPALCWLPKTPVGWSILGAATVMAAVGFVDDLLHIKPATKLLAQLGAGCLLVLGGLRIDTPWPLVSVPLTILWIAFMANAVNLLDNMDGLAAGTTAIAGGFCLLHALWASQAGTAILSASLMGASLGFLLYNFPPARIFMGDVGSQFLGTALAATALSGTWQHSTQLASVLAAPLLILSVPIFDTLFVSLQRLAHGQHPFHGGTDHVSHRLAILGLTERQTVAVIYLLSFAFGVLSLVFLYLEPMTAAALTLFALSLFLLLGAYLARVRVYEIQRVPEAAPSVSPGGVFIQTVFMHKRRMVEVAIDFVVICGAYIAAHVLRFEHVLNDDLQRLIIRSLPLVLLIKLSIFFLCGLYRGVWRYAGLDDLVTIVKAVTLGAAASALALLLLWRFEGYSRAVFVIDWALLVLGIGAARMAERVLNEWFNRVGQSAPRRVLVFGAGDGGALVLRELSQNRRLNCLVLGLLDDDRRKLGLTMHGVRVLGSRNDLPRLARQWGIEEILIAIPSATDRQLAGVYERCIESGVRWRHAATLVPMPEPAAHA